MNYRLLLLPVHEHQSSLTLCYLVLSHQLLNKYTLDGNSVSTAGITVLRPGTVTYHVHGWKTLPVKPAMAINHILLNRISLYVWVLFQNPVYQTRNCCLLLLSPHSSYPVPGPDCHQRHRGPHLLEPLPYPADTDFCQYLDPVLPHYLTSHPSLTSGYSYSLSFTSFKPFRVWV